MFTRAFDKSYLLLIIPILRMTWSVLQYRTRAIIAIPFMLLWFLSQNSRTRQSVIPSFRLNQYYFLTVFYFVLYMLLPLLYRNFNPGDRLAFRPMVAFGRIIEFLFMFTIVHFTLLTGKIRELKFCTCLVFLTFLWNGIAALRGGAKVVEYGGARLLVALSQQGEKSSEYYDKVVDVVSAGMGGADSVYVSAFAIPLLLLSIAYVHGVYKKVCCIVLAYCSYLNIKYGGLNTPIMITAAGIILMSLVKFKRRNFILGAGIIMALSVVLFSFNPRIMSWMSRPLRTVGFGLENLPAISSRCLSLADAVEGDKNTYAALRYELQKKSAVAFVHGNILVGRLFNRKGEGGGHSELLDCLAAYGLLGLFVIILFWNSYLKYCNQLSKVSLGEKWLYVPYIYAGAWIFSSVPNPALLGAPALMLIIPGLAVFYDEFERKWRIR